jgi:hypothetical protein
VSEGRFRLVITYVLTTMAAALPWADHAQAQFFQGFSAPQHINTARGAIQLAPGWHVATTPVRAGQGYRVAVRSDYGEQRNMFIGANGSLSVESAPRPGVMRSPARPLKTEQAPRRGEAQKPKVKVAVIKAPAKSQAAPPTPGRDAAPVSIAAPAANSKAPTPQTNDAPATWKGLDPMAPQTPGFAHGVPINALD